MEGNEDRPGRPDGDEQQAGPTGMGPPSGVPGGYGDTAAPVETKRGLTGAKLTALVAVVVLALAGVAIGIVVSGSEDGANLDEIVPADSIIYVRANLSPSGSQRDNLQAILDRFPRSEGRTVGEAIRDFVDEGLREEGTGITFRDDIAPWLGDQVGFVITGFDLNAGEPRLAFVASVRDAARARASLQRIKEGEDQRGEQFNFDVRDGAAFIAPDLLSLERALGVVDGRVGALSENADFNAAVDRLGGDYLGLVWMDGRSLADILPPGALPELPGALGGGVGGTAMIVLRAESDAAVVEGFGSGQQTETAGGSPALVEAVSQDIIATMTLFDPASIFEGLLGFADLAMGLGQSFERSFEEGTITVEPASLTLAPQEGSARDFVDGFLRQTLGISLDEDVLPWMHGELSVIVGNVALPSPDVGVLIESTDDGAARRTIDALRDRLGGLGAEGGFEVTSAPGGLAITFEEGITLVVRRIAGRVVIATSDGYADELLAAAPQALADDTVYRRTVGDPGADGVSFQMFVRLDRIIGLVRAFGGAEVAEAGPYLDPLQALGIRGTSSGTESTFRMVLTFK